MVPYCGVCIGDSSSYAECEFGSFSAVGKVLPAYIEVFDFSRITWAKGASVGFICCFFVFPVLGFSISRLRIDGLHTRQ